MSKKFNEVDMIERKKYLEQLILKKIIIVKDYINKYMTENGILVMNIFDFLLDESSLDR